MNGANNQQRPASSGPVRRPSLHQPSPSPTPVIEMEDDIPLVAEVYENQRYYPVLGWSAKLMDRPSWSSGDGQTERNKDDFKVPPGWTWAGEWQIEIHDGPNGTTDSEGWSYATDFTRNYRGSGDASLKAVRRRRHFRRRVPPAQSVKVALGLAGGPKSNALTVGLMKNTLAVSNTVRSANGYSVMSHKTLNSSTLAGRGGATRPPGNPSLAELYAKQTVDPPAGGADQPTPTNGPSVVTDGSLDIAGPVDASISSTPTSASGFSSASSTLTPAAAGALLSSLDSPSLQPKYVPFSSLSVLGLDDLTSFQPEILAKVMVKIWEYQRYYPIAGWSHRMLPTDNKGRGAWINHADGKKCEPKESFQLSPDWCWSVDNWASVIDSSTDVEGWSYAIEPTLTYHPRKALEHFVRRRMWQREKQERGKSKGPKKSYTAFFERLEFFKRDLKAEEKDEDLVAMTSATW